MEYLLQGISAEGFGNKIVHSAFEAALAVAGHGMGGHGDDGNGGKEEIFADTAGRFHAIHAGHLDIHKDERIRFGLECVEGFGSVGGGVNREAELAKPCGGDLGIDRIILDEKDGVDGSGIAGRWLRGGERLRIGWRSGIRAGNGVEGFGEVAAIDGFDQSGVEEVVLAGCHSLQSGVGGEQLDAGQIPETGIGQEGFSEVAARHFGHGLINESDGGNRMAAISIEVAEGLRAGGKGMDGGPP